MGDVREYLWSVLLSGVLIKVSNGWKIASLHFSSTKPDFPDERFEACDDYLKNIMNKK